MVSSPRASCQDLLRRHSGPARGPGEVLGAVLGACKRLWGRVVLLPWEPSFITLAAEMQGAEKEGGWEKCWVWGMRPRVGDSGLWLHLLLWIQILKKPQIGT